MRCKVPVQWAQLPNLVQCAYNCAVHRLYTPSKVIAGNRKGGVIAHLRDGRDGCWMGGLIFPFLTAAHQQRSTLLQHEGLKSFDILLQVPHAEVLYTLITKVGSTTICDQPYLCPQHCC